MTHGNIGENMDITNITNNGLNPNNTLGFSVCANGIEFEVQGNKDDTQLVICKAIDVLEQRIKEKQTQYEQGIESIADMTSYMGDQIYIPIGSYDDLKASHSMLKSIVLFLERLQREVFALTIEVLWLKNFDPERNLG